MNRVPKIESLIDSALEILNGSAPPEVDTNVFCDGCRFYAHCHRNQPSDDVVFLPRIRTETVTNLRESGYSRISQIPDDFELSELQSRAVVTVKSGKPFENLPKLREALALELPLVALDFESFAEPIPRFAGLAPFESVPFQWSAHVSSRVGAAVSECEHYEFLPTTSGDPRPEFVRTLLKVVERCGSIVHYARFELQTTKQLAAAGVPNAERLNEIMCAKSVDLLEVIRECLYVEEFRGRFSLKQVLPVMVPGIGYGDLAIQDGESASAAYVAMLNEGVFDQRRTELLSYCKRDTEALLLLLEALVRISNLESQKPRL